MHFYKYYFKKTKHIFKKYPLTLQPDQMITEKDVQEWITAEKRISSFNHACRSAHESHVAPVLGSCLSLSSKEIKICSFYWCYPGDVRASLSRVWLCSVWQLKVASSFICWREERGGGAFLWSYLWSECNKSTDFDIKTNLKANYAAKQTWNLLCAHTESRLKNNKYVDRY